MSNTEQKCPICKQNVYKMERYPNYVCNKCIEEYKTYTEEGKKITFHNTSIYGGFESYVEGDTQPSEYHTCFINGVKCYASETRFGGIVIQPMIFK
jgi:hypothetical protein